jgi:hypothetical protein
MTYEETWKGSKVWKPLYKCLWFGCDPTWQNEDTIPQEFLSNFKSDRQHFMTEDEFHKRQNAAGRKKPQVQPGECEMKRKAPQDQSDT